MRKRKPIKPKNPKGFIEVMFGHDKGWWICLLNPIMWVFMPIFISQYIEYRMTGKEPDPEL